MKMKNGDNLQMQFIINSKLVINITVIYILTGVVLSINKNNFVHAAEFNSGHMVQNSLNNDDHLLAPKIASEASLPKKSINPIDDTPSPAKKSVSIKSTEAAMVPSYSQPAECFNCNDTNAIYNSADIITGGIISGIISREIIKRTLYKHNIPRLGAEDADHLGQHVDSVLIDYSKPFDSNANQQTSAE